MDKNWLAESPRIFDQTKGNKNVILKANKKGVDNKKGKSAIHATARKMLLVVLLVGITVLGFMTVLSVVNDRTYGEEVLLKQRLIQDLKKTIQQQIENSREMDANIDRQKGFTKSLQINIKNKKNLLKAKQKEEKQEVDKIRETIVKQLQGKDDKKLNSVYTSLFPEPEPEPQDPYTLSIVMAFHDIVGATNFLDMIENLNVPKDVTVELVLVDDRGDLTLPCDIVNGTVKKVDVVVLRNFENIGYLKSLNRAMKNARGTYIALMNFDVSCETDYIGKMLKTFKIDPKIALVGPRYRDKGGALAEAGGIIFRDGSAINAGRFIESLHGRPFNDYEYVRDVDYVSSSASIAKASILKQVGYLDELYSPKDYEDVDLSFKLREKGYRVVYQPLAVVTHYGGSIGDDESTGKKIVNNLNQQKFIGKWNNALKSHLVHPHNHDKYHKASRHLMERAGRILICDSILPTPDKDSGSVRIMWMINILMKMGFGISFLQFDPNSLNPEAKLKMEQLGVHVLPSLPDIGTRDIKIMMKELSVKDFPDFKDQGKDPRSDDPNDDFWPIDYDFVIVCKKMQAESMIPLLRKWSASTKIVYDTVDLHFLRETRQHIIEKGNGEKIDLVNVDWTSSEIQKVAEGEVSLMRMSDATIAVSDFEQELLQQKFGIDNVVRVSNIHVAHPTMPDFSSRHGIVFIGNWNHQPNFDAVNWICESLFPRFKMSVPAARFFIIGANYGIVNTMPKSCLDDPIVLNLGQVADLHRFYSSVRISVAPLRYGAGVKGKVNTAMRYGVPIVATNMATEGMHVEDGINALVADKEDEFVEKMVKLYNDEQLWNNIRQGGFDNLDTWFSVETAKNEIEYLLVHKLFIFPQYE